MAWLDAHQRQIVSGELVVLFEDECHLLWGDDVVVLFVTPLYNNTGKCCNLLFDKRFGQFKNLAKSSI